MKRVAVGLTILLAAAFTRAAGAATGSDGSVILPDGGAVPDSGSGMLPDGMLPDGGEMPPDGAIFPDGGMLPDGGMPPDAGSGSNSDAGTPPADAPPDAGSDIGVISTSAVFDFGTLTVGDPPVTIPFAITDSTLASVTLDQLQLSGPAPGLELISNFTGPVTLTDRQAFPAALQLTPIAPTDLATLNLYVVIGDAQSTTPLEIPIIGMVVPARGSQDSNVGDTTFYACATRSDDGGAFVAVAVALALVTVRRRSGSSSAR